MLKTPPRTPQANGLCERLVGTFRRECHDFLIPLSERHLKSILKEFIVFYNRGRPHMALGPGIPGSQQVMVPASVNRYLLSAGHRVNATSVLGGLHHEYHLEKEAT